MQISSARVIVGVVFFCLGIAAALASSTFTTMMISEINRQRKEDNQIAYLGFIVDLGMRKVEGQKIR